MRRVKGLAGRSGTARRNGTARIARTGAAGILAALAGLLLASAGVTTASAGGMTAPSASDPESGLTRYGSCLNAQRDGDLLLLLDTSSSMQLTDPDAARVDAADYLLQQLASYTQASGVTIAVAVTGFADSIESVAGWTPLDSSSVGALTGAVDSFRDRVDGFETDYWTALEGARQSFTERSRLTPDVHRCQAVAWFTDGELKISARTSDDELAQYGANKPYSDGTLDTDEAAVDATGAASADICRAAGIADQLRAIGVVTLAVGLAPTGAPAPNFDLLRSISTGAAGSGGAGSCGSISSPAPGEFYTVADFNDLMLAFDRLSTPGQAPIENQKHVCQGSPCASEQHSFVIDASIPAVHILATADAPGLTVLLTPPGGGAAITLAPPGIGVPQSTAQNGNAVGYTWRSDSAVSIDLSRGAAGTGWAGLWSVTFVDPTATTPEALSRTSIHLSADLFPAWLNRDEMALSSGPNEGLRFGIIDSAGTAVDPAALAGTAILSVDVLGADGKQFPIIVGGERTGIAAPAAADLTGLPPGPATMRMTLQLTTAATVDPANQPVSGTALAPRSVDLPVMVSPAPAVGADSAAPYPTVAYQVDFGTTDGVDPANGQLTVNGPGCVWLDTTVPTSILGSPRGVGQIAVTSPAASAADSCLAVAAGASGALPLVLTVDQPQSGGVNGSIVVMISPDGQFDRAVGVPVSFAADVRKPLVPELFAAVFAVALILALGLPLAMLYLAKYFSARIPQIPLAYGVVPVSVVDGQVSRTGGRFALSDADTRQVVSVSGGGRRRLPLSTVELCTKMGRSPIGSGYVVVESPGRVGAAGGQPPWTRRGLQARLPLAAHNSWAILHDPAGDPTEAEILVLLDASGDDRARQRIAEDVRRRAADLLSALRDAARESGNLPPTAGRATVGVRAGSSDDDDEPARGSSGSSGFLFGPDD